MEFFLKFDINFFSIFMLLILYLTIKMRKEATGTSSNLFFKLLWMTILLLILEILSWVFDRIPGQNTLNYLFNFIFVWSTTLISSILASYIDYHMFGSYDRLRRRKFYIYPFALTGILLTVNFYHPIIFSVSPDNVYSREAFMMLLPIICISLFMYICYLAYKNRAHIQKEVIWVLLLYISMSVIAAFLQVQLFGVFIMWPMMAVTVMLTYIFLETVSTSRDYLTGLLSRHRIDDYLEYMLDQNKSFALVMLDLNHFKSINDTYGHLSGDTALQVFSVSLKKHFKKAKVVGRYAGDEFILILEDVKCDDIEISLKKVEKELGCLHESGEIEFPITFSYGCFEHKPDTDLSYEDIINLVDKRMYENKSHQVS
ncbi:diguanylate cyclase (GGDEF) domain-containing protein [Dethiosulfatibacter aminovorans DSM 17477]|uniref:Diguanylate cyclase (GGDEF) domain-containing protein n=1 Tax=Dethiosulfatibacter aminovorans DSM 17477 TaxID=1121476 RepID=A0A1M6I4L6_9FIRM|nr:GGDEF domain-containing protein [Dethiosulfatibacter aminovorans]SHJ29401.1 diguanylate cyclase (GGDEF) domain-containing protein [Dethiosulfatibacter aminovorans DSM 17477]